MFGGNLMYTRMVRPVVLRPHAQSPILSSSPVSIIHASQVILFSLSQLVLALSLFSAVALSMELL